MNASIYAIHSIVRRITAEDAAKNTISIRYGYPNHAPNSDLLGTSHRYDSYAKTQHPFGYHLWLIDVGSERYLGYLSSYELQEVDGITSPGLTFRILH